MADENSWIPDAVWGEIVTVTGRFVPTLQEDKEFRVLDWVEEADGTITVRLEPVNG